MNRRGFLKASVGAVATAALTRREVAAPDTVFGVRLMRRPLSEHRHALLMSFMGQSAICINSSLSLPVAMRVTAYGLFVTFRDRPRVAAIEADGSYYNHEIHGKYINGVRVGDDDCEVLT